MDPWWASVARGTAEEERTLIETQNTDCKGSNEEAEEKKLRQEKISSAP